MKASRSKKSAGTSRSHWRTITAAIFGFFGLSLLLAQLSYLLNWKKDFSALDWSQQSEAAANWLGKAGAYAGYMTVFKGYGVAVLLGAWMLIMTAWWIFRKEKLFHILSRWIWTVFFIGFLSWIIGLIFPGNPVWSGLGGLHSAQFTTFYLGKWGSFVLALFATLILLAYFFKLGPEQLERTMERVASPVKSMKNWSVPFKRSASGGESKTSETATDETESGPSPEDNPPGGGVTTRVVVADEEEIPETKDSDLIISVHGTGKTAATTADETAADTEGDATGEKDFKVVVQEEELVDKANELVEQYGEFDPTLELSQYRFPHFGLLKDYDNVKVQLDEEELQHNNEKIIQTLKNFGIEIVSIEAKVGPTVTLYEIVPAPGTRISKIKNLEDDLAMSLAALGVRIIAPMPGKNTIGIEVANRHRTLVPLKRVLRSPKFQNADEMELPIALGKNISNETFVFDLAAMPHLLIAGATGQGKSVGINVILNSLLFKKHPAELKFVLVDPKKVELSLYTTIEKHFLAKLPGEAEAIISDPAKVKQTLHSLIQEVGNRLDLFKKAKVRKISEYNQKFKERKLNPAKGHRFLPYIVVVIDEFADFIYSAGKEVQVPLIKLAQISRAVGVHMVIATQRPSVDVITGLLKAQFPGRIAFRVASQFDSRTILDQNGAEKLLGKGDLLFRTDLGVTRLQCAFIDTSEVENVTNFIGEQPGYPSAYPLPEVDETEISGLGEDDDDDRDPLFEEAAYIIVSAQQGSASLLQRKLKIGYNRAGRLIDQMHKAGIVGPAEGSKPRKVNIPDIVELEKFLKKT